MSPHDLDNPQLPEPLRQELRRRYGHIPRATPEIDRLITASAHAHFARRHRLRLVARWTTAATAAAAIITAAILLPNLGRQPQAGQSPQLSSAPADLNADGRIDMLDVYLLASELHDHRQITPRCDINHDGVVDQRDVDALGMLAVSLGSEGRQ